MDKSTLKNKVVHALKLLVVVAGFIVTMSVMFAVTCCVCFLQPADSAVQRDRDDFLRRRKESAWQVSGLSVHVEHVVRTEDWTAYYVTLAYPLETNIPPSTRWIVLNDANSKYYVNYVPIDKL